MTDPLKPIWRWVVDHRVVVFVGAFAAAAFLYAYWLAPNRPGAMPDIHSSWDYWFDQGQYLKEAKAIHAGNLDRTQYSYPMGYPAVGAIFVGFMKTDPFMVINLAVFVFVIIMYYLVASQFFDPVTTFFTTMLLVLATSLLSLTVIPWTTTATLPAAMVLMWLLFVKPELSYWNSAIAAVLLVWAYMARGGGELLLLVPIGLALIWKYRRQPGLIKRLALGAVIIVAGVVLNALWTKTIYGHYINPYINAVEAFGFSIRHIPRAFIGTVIYSGNKGSWWPPLLATSFWLVLAPVGMVLALLPKRDRWLHAGAIASIILGFAVTTSFNNYGPQTLKYYSLHYLKIWLPFLALYATMTWQWLLRHQKSSGS